MRLSLITADSLDNEVVPLQRIVAAPEFRGVEQDSQDLRIGAGRPPGKPIKRGKHEQTAHQAAEEIERRGSQDQGHEKQAPLGPQNREGFVHRRIHWMECWITGMRCALAAGLDHGKSQVMKFTAPIAMPTPNTIPASMRLESPSPKLNIKPPTTI